MAPVLRALLNAFMNPRHPMRLRLNHARPVWHAVKLRQHCAFFVDSLTVPVHRKAQTSSMHVDVTAMCVCWRLSLSVLHPMPHETTPGITYQPEAKPCSDRLRSSPHLRGPVVGARDTDQDAQADEELIGSRRQTQHQPHAGARGRLEVLPGAGKQPLGRLRAAWMPGCRRSVLPDP